jgi:hypothetical protein
MAIMNIHAQKLDLIGWISNLDNISILKRLYQIKVDYSKSQDWEKSLKKEEIESIKRGLKDISEGKVYSHETALEVYGKYL